MRRPLHLLTAALCTLLCTALPPLAAPASAGVLDVTCIPPSSETVTINPALTMTPQTVTVTVSTQYAPCTSLSVPALTSGSRQAQFTSPGRSCLTLLDSASVTYTITWNTGQTSTVSGNSTFNMVGAVMVVTITGSVTSGLFTGDTVIQTVTGPATDITTCTLGLGTVSNLFGLMTLEITSI
jgi:hypothetical protein